MKGVSVITCANHGIRPGDKIVVNGVEYVVGRVTATTMTLGANWLQRAWYRCRYLLRKAFNAFGS